MHLEDFPKDFEVIRPKASKIEDQDRQGALINLYITNMRSFRNVLRQASGYFDSVQPLPGGTLEARFLILSPEVLKEKYGEEVGQSLAEEGKHGLLFRFTSGLDEDELTSLTDHACEVAWLCIDEAEHTTVLDHAPLKRSLGHDPGFDLLDGPANTEDLLIAQRKLLDMAGDVQGLLGLARLEIGYRVGPAK